MILTIIAILILIATITLVIIALKTGASELLFIPMFLSLIAGISVGLVIDTAINFDTKEYDMIMREVEYGQTYSSDVEAKIYSWNEDLTKHNNYWFRFETKDREPYYIDVNIYLDKFKS